VDSELRTSEQFGIARVEIYLPPKNWFCAVEQRFDQMVHLRD